GADVAVKILMASRREDSSRIDRFKRESLICQRLSHPNIVRIHDIGHDGARYYLSMELLEGQDLGRAIADGALPLWQIVEVARAVLSALEAAHEAGVVHRDLKPANVFLTRQGGVKVLDFGIATAHSLPGQTADGAIVGTP